MNTKLKWKVAEAPSGRYRSFQQRGWPTAHFENGNPAVQITCEDSYRPANVKSGDHAELSVLIACYPEVRENGAGAFTWRRMKAKFKTLDEAKAAGQRFIDAHEEHRPPVYRNLTA